MATIKLKGQNEPLITEYSIAEAARRIWESSAPNNSKINLGDLTVEKSGIQWINLKAGAPDKKDDHKSEQTDKDYYLYRREKLSLSPKIRAQSTGLFELLYRSLTGQKANLETLSQAIVVQEKFFTDNPKRIYCNPVLFRDLISGKEDLDQWESSAYKMVERCVEQDMVYAKQNQ